VVSFIAYSIFSCKNWLVCHIARSPDASNSQNVLFQSIPRLHCVVKRARKNFSRRQHDDDADSSIIIVVSVQFRDSFVFLRVIKMTNRVTFVKNDFGRGSTREFRGLEPHDIVIS
jgi:hypothetical protein